MNPIETFLLGVASTLAVLANIDIQRRGIRLRRQMRVVIRQVAGELDAAAEGER